MITALVCTIVVLVLAPFSIYISVKFGVYAYLNAHRLFDQIHKGNDSNG